MFLNCIGTQDLTQYIPLDNQSPASPSTTPPSGHSKQIQDDSLRQSAQTNTEAAVRCELSGEPEHIGACDSKDKVSKEDKASKEGKSAGEASETAAQKQGFTGELVSETEVRELNELKRRDREVRAHEQAHVGAGAGLVRGGAHYQYKKGPDGRLYAVGGEVSIDTSEGRTPQETIQKMDRVKAAALAPANPSPQDRNVAAEAAGKATKARMELARETTEAVLGPSSGQYKQGEFGVSKNPEDIKAYQPYQNPSSTPSMVVGDLIDIAV